MPASSHHSQLPVQPGSSGQRDVEERHLVAAGPSGSLPQHRVLIRQHLEVFRLQRHGRADRRGPDASRHDGATEQLRRVPPVQAAEQ